MIHDHTTLALVFLDPAAGIIAASLALPALLLLYFLKLRRRPVRISSTMLWDRAVEDLQVNAPFRWLRASLLLLLQFLALALLAGALGRPALLDPAAPPEGRVVLLIDRSASMNATDGDAQGATRLDAARLAANEFIARLRPGETEAMVVSFAADARIESPYTDSRALLRDAVAAIEPTDQPGDLDGALELVSAFVSPSGEESEPVPATVVLFSDGALERAAPERRASIPGASFRFRRMGPVPDAARDNLGLVAMSARRDETDPRTLRLFARVLNAGPEPVETALAVRLNDAPTSAQALLVPGADENGPGQAPVTLSFPAPDGGLVVASIARDDALTVDNAAALVAAPPSDLRVWLVSGGAPNPDLREALALLVPGPDALRVMALAEYERTIPIASPPPDLIVFDRARPTALPAIPTISFGATLPIPGLGVADGSTGATRFLTWRRTHPLLRDVVLDAVIVSRPLALTLPEEQPTVVSTPLAQGEDGALIALLEQGSVRRIIVAFDLDASTWALSYSFPIFIANAVDYLAGALGPGAGGVARGYLTTDPITVRAAPEVQTIRVRGPIELDAPVRANDRAAPLGSLPLVGVYSAEGAAPRDATLAVNLLNDHESRIATASAVEVASASTRGGGSADGAPREIWPWFVLAAGALLTMEWFLFAWQMRV